MAWSDDEDGEQSYDGYSDGGGGGDHADGGWTSLDVDAAPELKKSYLVLSEDGLRARQEECTARVAELLSVPPGFAAVLLRHYRWSVARLEDAWFSEEQRVRGDVGLPAGGAPAVLSDGRLTCAICFHASSAGEAMSAGCSHFYCRACWRGYVGAAVAGGPRCLSLRCPDPSCSVAVVRELVDLVAGDEDRLRYATFALRSYVEESNKVRRWCPASRCAHAAELLSGDGEQRDVLCECKHGFCLQCGEEAHRPASCEVVRNWLAKVSSESELSTTSWVQTHTKRCPKCRRQIEKNHGCAHMTCLPPCGHQFCWRCLGPWNEHVAGGDGDGDPYECKRHKKGRTLAKPEASPDKQYRYYHERWEANQTRRRRALAAMEELQSRGELDTVDLNSLVKAYAVIAGGRRVLMWVYACGYFLGPEREELKHELFELLKADAEGWLRRLQEAVWCSPGRGRERTWRSCGV